MAAKRRCTWILGFLLAIAYPMLATAQDADEAKRLELGQQLLDLAGTKERVLQMMDQISPALIQLVEQANPGKEKEVVEVMGNYIFPRMKQNLPDAVRSCAVVYANHFSADELSQLVAFYQSPLGRKLVQEQPGMIRELSQLGAVWAQQAARQAIHDYADEFRKRGLDLPI